MSKILDLSRIQDPMRAQDINQNFIRTMEWVRELARGLADIAENPVKGAVPYFDGTKIAWLPPGTAGQTLKMGSNGLPEWV